LSSDSVHPLLPSCVNLVCLPDRFYNSIVIARNLQRVTHRPQ
jgi:hypothetical protein